MEKKMKCNKKNQIKRKGIEIKSLKKKEDVTIMH